jgi:hypothetical protein
MLRAATARLLPFLSAGLLTAIGPAGAQPRPSGIAPAPSIDPRIVAGFARCVVERHHPEAAAYALSDYADWRTAPRTTPAALEDQSCVPATASQADASLLLKLPENSIKFALADALVRQEFPVFDAAVILTARPLKSSSLVDALYPPGACRQCGAKQLAEVQQARARMSAIVAPIVFGECAVRTDPSHAHALVMAPPGSSQEKAMLEALAAALGSCVAQGGQFAATRPMLRGIIAISYYRVAHAPRLAPGAAPR